MDLPWQRCELACLLPSSSLFPSFIFVPSFLFSIHSKHLFPSIHSSRSTLHLEPRISVELGINCQIKAGQENLVGGKGSQEEAKESKTPSLPLFGIPHNKIHQSNNHICQGLEADPCRLHNCGFSLCEPCLANSVDHVLLVS